ncbi:hypothetical protein J6590_079040 [Homalodisca vitripennis]|nr:hypothetical protein J6590_079040 [Homalodisca vitripennis]
MERRSVHIKKQLNKEINPLTEDFFTCHTQCKVRLRCLVFALARNATELTYRYIYRWKQRWNTKSHCGTQFTPKVNLIGERANSYLSSVAKTNQKTNTSRTKKSIAIETHTHHGYTVVCHRGSDATFLSSRDVTTI